MNGYKCDECIYYNKGECRRYPPVLVPNSYDSDGEDIYNSCEFPMVSATNWCGEYKKYAKLHFPQEAVDFYNKNS